MTGSLAEVERTNWSGPDDIKAAYPSASFPLGNRVVFNVKGNKYRELGRPSYYGRPSAWIGRGTEEARPLALSLRFTENGRLHDDVELRMGGHLWVCDSYYFTLDRNLLPEREDIPKIKAVLRRLLEQWVSAVEGLQDAGVVFLPYDFSDECTAWLRCERTGGQIEVCHGWASVPGYSFSPSDIGAYVSRAHGFAPDGGTSIHTTVDALVDAIRSSMLHL